MVWMVVTRGASAAGKGAARGAGAVAKGAARGTRKLGQVAGRGAGKAGKAGQAGTKRAAAGAGKGARTAAPAGGQAGRAGLDPRTVARARKAARTGQGEGRLGSPGSRGSGGSGGSGPGRSGRPGQGGRPRGWAGRAVDAATGRGRGGRGGGPGARAVPGVEGEAGEASGGAGGTDAAAAEDALRSFVRNRLRRRRGPFKRSRNRLHRICLAILVLLLALPLLMGLYGADAVSDQMEAVMAMQCSGAPVELMSEQTGIPVDAVAAYCSAAVQWQVNWAVLAAIGKVECDHGRYRAPGCDPGPPRTVNDKGARGPMQFLGSTWRSSAGAMDLDVSGPPIPEGNEGAGYATDGDGDGVADPWSWPDATHAAARYLLANGYAEDQRRALYAYNHSWDYVDDVSALASEYRSTVTSVMDQEDMLAGGGGTLAIGGCPWTAEGSTAPVPASKNTRATQTMANTLLACFGRNGHGVGCYAPRTQADGRDGPYEHPRGRACDFMMANGVAGGHDRERGRAMAEWAQAHAEELNILYVIWYNRIWSRSRDGMAVKPWNQWRDYGCGGCAPSPGHYDHVHVSVKLMPDDPPLAACVQGIPCTE